MLEIKKQALDKDVFWYGNFSGEDINRIVNELSDTYPGLRGHERDVKVLIMSYETALGCWDCQNSLWEGGCESTPNGPAEPGYWYCGLPEKKRELIGAEGYEEGFGGCEFCPYWKAKSAEQRLREYEERRGLNYGDVTLATLKRLEREVENEAK